MKYLNMAIEQDPTNVTYYFAQGTLYERFGDEENAVKSYKKTMEIDPTFFNAYYNLGFAQMQLKQYAEAISNFEKASSAAPGSKARIMMAVPPKKRAGHVNTCKPPM